MNATGRVGFDQSLYLDVQAGPIKKLTKQLGAIGRGIDQITSHITRYRVTGTLEEPVVTVLIFSSPDQRPPDPDTPRDNPASEIFTDIFRIGPSPDDKQTEQENEKWEERRERDGMIIEEDDKTPADEKWEDRRDQSFTR